MMRRLAFWNERAALDAQLRDELQAHVELLARDLSHEGMAPDAALAEARRRMGNVTRQREESREYWGFPALEAVVQDVRYAVRGLLRSPVFTITVVVTLGLGIGANAAMFAVIDRLMFRPHPYMRAPSEVHRVYLQSTYRGKVNTRAEMPYTRYLDLARATHSFAQVAAVSEWRLAVGTGDETRVRRVDGVSASFFAFFDAPPALGRYFVAAEDSAPAGTRVAVLSHGYWKSAFGGRGVLDERLQIGNAVYTIIGVAPEGFVGAGSGSSPELFIPVTTVPANINPSARDNYATVYNWDWMGMLVRRRAGVTTESATADLTSAYKLSRGAQRLITPTVLPDSLAKPRSMVAAVRSAAGPDAGLESRVLLWVTGVAGIVLLIACANVANLMFARVVQRRREIAVRLALGVGRGRLVRQLTTEGAVLAIAGAIAGLMIAQWGGMGVRHLLLPEGSSFSLVSDWRTIGVAGLCALAAILLTTIGPAVMAGRSDLSTSLKAGARAGTFQRSRTRSALLIAQGALSVALLVGAALFVRSLQHVLSIPLGYDATSVMEVRPDFRAQHTDSVTELAARRRLLEVAQTLPGVEHAARVNSMLFSTSTASLYVPGIDSVARLGRFNFQVTTADYFATMRTRIVRGRGFTASDREGTPPVAVVSHAMANVLWPGEDAIGQCIHVGGGPLGARAEETPCTTVVGIAEDAAEQNITDDERFMYYLSADQLPASWASTILVRLAPGAAEGGTERVRRAMQAVMPGDGFVIVRPMAERLDDQRRSWRLGATLFTALGALALVVAAVGLYGVIGYSVTQRMHELGVRIALGARTADILRLIVGEGLAFAGAGVATGLTIAFVAGHWMQPLLYKESAHDPVAYAMVGAAVGIVALLASAIPAMRAARTDPNIALRTD